MKKTRVRTDGQPKTSKRRTLGPGDSECEVTFRLQAEAGSEVHVAGTFNGWNPEEHPLAPDGDGGYSTTLRLPRGTHEYKFVINGAWCVDPVGEEWTPNGVGSINSVLSIL